MEIIRTYWIFGVGFLAQLLFGIRIVIQWWIAEKRRESVSPSLFWKFSLAGSAIFLVYGILRTDIVIIVGQIISYVIYIRNLQLKGDWPKLSGVLRFFLASIPPICMLWTLGMAHEVSFTTALFQDMNGFLLVGAVGQVFLNLRFLYQWYYSEKQKQSILPTGFWWLSISGGVLVIIYSIYRRDPVLLLAQGMAIVPYTRNLILSTKRN
ncbi:MAG: lipid-A-disaccharide synthase N-terminal domain-containing protein [Flammeovirgaceae bacterium]|nr:MAG: lipid-A-disaccharide synthase N-terminal domain-containing protein [Flammeovirgaceae bacterium]